MYISYKNQNEYGFSLHVILCDCGKHAVKESGEGRKQITL